MSAVPRWLNLHPGIMFILICMCFFVDPTPCLSEPIETLEETIRGVLAEKGYHSADPTYLVRLADLYLDLGDEQAENPERLAAYRGRQVARQALDLQEQNAHAHYLYAANLGSAAQLKGVMASALTLAELKIHVHRALELKPDHASALQHCI